MSVITLTSDFGYKDHRVAAIKGKILTLNQEAKFVDITHGISAYNLLQTSYIVRNAYRHFPEGSIHIISVDSFYTKDRKLVLYKADGHYFIAADNGVLSLVFTDIKPETIYEITFNNRFDDEVNFTSTDIFVPVAIHLQNGGLPEVIGRKMKNPRELSYPRASSTESKIVGEALYIDNFENVVTNIPKKLFEENLKKKKDFVINFRNMALTKVYDRYTEMVSDWEKETEYHGKAAAIFNENGLLELIIYKGIKNSGARNLLGLKIGDQIFIEFL